MRTDFLRVYKHPQLSSCDMTDTAFPIYQGTRPIATRKIPIKYASYRGQVNTTKQHLRNIVPPQAYPYESQLERDFYYCIDHDQHCREIIPQPLFKNDNGIKYSADCWAVFYTDQKWIAYLFEIKPSSKLPILACKNTWNKKITYLTNVCQEHDWHFKIITDDHIYTNRLRNIRIFRVAARLPPGSTTITTVKETLSSIYRHKEILTFSNLVTEILEKLKNTLQPLTIETVLYYLLFYQDLWFDWEQTFSPTDSIIHLNLDHSQLIEPFNMVQPSKHVISHDEVRSIPAEIDLDLISPEQKEEALERFNAVKPLLQLETKRRVTRNDVEKQAKKHSVTVMTIYNWLRTYKTNSDWKNLFTKNHIKGNRDSRLLPEVEEIVQSALANRAKMASTKACWKQIKETCETNGLPVPSYKTITLRVKKQPALERLGKQGGYIRDEIARSIIGTLPRGEYPLDFVQVDSTKLDIFLINQFNKKIKKRPYLTIAIDSRTRMIYTWLLDYAKPNAIAISQTIMRGILPKDELLRKFEIDLPYPIYGVPRRIQFDNAKEFDSNHVKEFCMLRGVEDFQFRHAKRPDLGGYVERIFRTINENWIRDNALPGYAPPLRNRPEGIKPEKDAKWTLPKFEQWLVRQFVIYHHEPHRGLEKDTGVKRSPIEQYRLDMTGRENPRTINKELIQFEIYPSVRRVLRPEGINFIKNSYNDDGRTKKLSKIRRQNRGVRKKILFRFDPQDITAIWVYDPEEREYIPVKVSGGLLGQFVRKYPEIPVTLSEFKAVKQFLLEEGRTLTATSVTNILIETQQIAEEIEKQRQMEKQSSRTTKFTREKEEEEKDDSEDPFADLEFPPELLHPPPRERKDPFSHLNLSLDDVVIKQGPTRKDKQDISATRRRK